MLKKKAGFIRADSLPADNLARISGTSQTADEKRANAGTVACMARMLDSIASGEVSHFVVGQPRQGGSFLITANATDGSKQYVGFRNIYEVGTVVLGELFED